MNLGDRVFILNNDGGINKTGWGGLASTGVLSNHMGGWSFISKRSQSRSMYPQHPLYFEKANVLLLFACLLFSINNIVYIHNSF